MSITHDGAIASCLDIERRPETTFGSVYADNVIDVWRRRFETWRKPNGLATDSTFCDGCEEAHVCRGDSAHSWDYDKGEPRICVNE